MKQVDFLCFGGEDWWYHNHGHADMQLMHHFAKLGTVLYINSIVMQRVSMFPITKFIGRFLRKARSIFVGLKRSNAGFWVYSPISLPVQHIRWAKPFNEMLLRLQLWCVKLRLAINEPVVWVVCPTACDIAIRMPKSKLIYQRTDRFEDFPFVNAEAIKKYDQQLKANADITIYVNKSLYEQEAEQCKKAFYLDHGVDCGVFASAEQNSEIPSDIMGISRPIVGYFGALDDHKLDFAFIEAVIDLLPHMSFVFVGKASTECSGLAYRKGVWLLGHKTYEQVPQYGKCFDVAIIPWKKSPWTEAANPIKLKEYLALGKPLVSTGAFTELWRYLDVVYIADSPEDFARNIEKAIAEDCSELISKRRKKVANATWENKAKIVLKELFSDEID